MAAAVGLAALADGWAAESSSESDDGLEAQAASRPRKRGRPPGRKRTLPPPAITAIVPRRKFVNPVALELRDVRAGTPSFSGLDLVTSVVKVAASLGPAEKTYVLVDNLQGGGVRPCIGMTAESASVGECRKHFGRTCLQVAAALHMGSLGAYASFLTRLQGRIASGEMEPVMMLQWGTFDETPLTLMENTEAGGAELPLRVRR